MSPQPLEIREDVPSRASKAEAVGIWCNSEERVQQGIVLANAVEAGRYYTLIRVIHVYSHLVKQY